MCSLEPRLRLLACAFLLALILAFCFQNTHYSAASFENSIDRTLKLFSSMPVDNDPFNHFLDSSNQLFLKPAHYQRDRAGAIDIFEKNAISICRIYRVCRLQNGDIFFPRWMKTHLPLLRDKCGLLNPRFAAAKHIRNHITKSLHYDWLAPNVPTPALLKFINNPLSYFFAHKKANRSLLDETSNLQSSVHRTCIPGPFYKDGIMVSAVCDNRPEGHIAYPAILVNTVKQEPTAYSDFYSLFRRTYEAKHGEKVRIFDPNSRALRQSKYCFRSIIASAAVDHAAGFTADNIATSRNNSGLSEQAGSSPETGSNRWHKTVSKGADNIETPPNGNDVHVDVSTRHSIARKASESPADALKMSFDTEQTKSEDGRELETEGGVELLTHQPVDGNMQKSSPAIGTSQEYYSVCRIYRACRGSDHSIILPRWMRKYASKLKNHCGLDSVSYINDGEFDSMFEGIRSSAAAKQSKSRIASDPDMEIYFDLIGLRANRAQTQHFMTDFLHDGIRSLDAFYNRDDTRTSLFKRRCLYKTKSIFFHDAMEQEKCSSSRIRVADLQPLLLLDDEPNFSGFHEHFIRQIVAMMPPKPNRGPELLRQSKLSKNGKGESTCFRSIVLTQNFYPPPSVLAAEKRNMFFTANNISREAVTFSSEDECKVHVAILSTEEESKQWVKGGGELIGEDEIVKAIMDVGSVLARDIAGPKAKIEVRKMNRVGKQLHEDAKNIQESEIIVSASQPSLTSIMFARPDTYVVEIQPFSYSTGLYRSFARSLKLNYEQVMAKADYEAFEECLKGNFKWDWTETLTDEEMGLKMRSLLNLFRKASEEFNGISSTLHLESREVANGKLREYYIPRERVCARAQRIRADPNLIATLVGSQAGKFCRSQSRTGTTRQV